MVSKDPQSTKRPSSAMPSDPSTDAPTRRRQTKGTSRKVTEARATAQRAKLDAQAQERQRKTELAQEEGKAKPSQGKQDQHDVLAQRRANTPIRRAIDDYLLDHTGGNRSDKTLEWHRTSLFLMLSFFTEKGGTRKETNRYVTNTCVTNMFVVYSFP